MAQSSIFWSTNGTGDGATAYTQAQLFDWISRTHINNPAQQGPYGGFAWTGTISPFQIGIGNAIVNGIPYKNDAAVSITVSTPVVGTTGYAVVLRADYTAQTVRIALKSSADGTSTIPTMTQNVSIWEVPLWSFQLTTGGVLQNKTNTMVLLNSGNATFYSSFSNVNGSTIVNYSKEFIAGSASGPTTITFPNPYPAGTFPAVTMSVYGSSSFNSANLFITSITNTGFVVSNNVTTGLTISYIAVL